jgi:hypothetical protein
MMDFCEHGEFQLRANGILTSQEGLWFMKLVSTIYMHKWEQLHISESALILEIPG